MILSSCLSSGLRDPVCHVDVANSGRTGSSLLDAGATVNRRRRPWPAKSAPRMPALPAATTMHTYVLLRGV